MEFMKTGSERAERDDSRYGAVLLRFNRNCLALMFFLAGLFAPAAYAGPIRVMAFGDSLFAGYGVADADNFPTQLEKALRADGKDVRLINASVSGDTTADGLARLNWSLADKPDLVLLELGGNDALRGLDPDQAKSNLDKILGALKSARIPVLICGMLAPRNLGPAYAQKFDPLFQELADKYHAPLYPFILDGVALDPKLTQPDGIHPNPQGVLVMVKKILPFVEKALPGG
jgi:acyl-CoA thioesterase-1